METIIARSYARLINAKRKTIDDVPAQILPVLKEIAPELFKDAH